MKIFIFFALVFCINAITLRDIVNYICQRDPNNSICTSYQAAFTNSTKDVIGLNVILANKTDNNKDLEVKQVVLDEVNSTVETLVENNETPKERDLPIDDLDKTNSQDSQVLVFKKNSSNFESDRKEYCSSFKFNYTKLCLRMQFIASKCIVHRDIAARNILLTDSFNAKISDFGLSCHMGNSVREQGYSPNKFPYKWLSIEALISKLFSEKSDVWAFGFGLEDLVDHLKAGNRLSRPEAADEQIYEIMLDCWKEDPEERPTFEALTSRLHTILADATKSYGYVESEE
uniref:Protein kinase domain-containing protein n=1 Tax=Acrobeloides nanus TaxID=290746 RepID=A0A914CT63_9BILA